MSLPYGYKNFKGRGYDYGCCEGHDRLQNGAFKPRSVSLTMRNLSRYPKKVERAKAKQELRKFY